MSYTDQLENEATMRGWQQCLDSVRWSLRGYPHAGGDLEIMREVARIVAEPIKAAVEGTSELRKTSGEHLPCCGTRVHPWSPWFRGYDVCPVCSSLWFRDSCVSSERGWWVTAPPAKQREYKFSKQSSTENTQ